MDKSGKDSGSSPDMKPFVALLLAVVLIGCAQNKTTCHCKPIPTRTLADFGCFDSTTTLQDIEARVGKWEWGFNISGHVSVDYYLGGNEWLRIQCAGTSKILWVNIVSRKHEDILVYEAPRDRDREGPFSQQSGRAAEHDGK